MAGFDRSKLKATPLASLKKQEQEHQTKRPSNGNGGDRNYHSLDDGDNKFRIFPAHPDGGGESFTEPKCVTFLECKVEKKDEKGKSTGEFEIKRKPVFNSKVHGNISQDLVEEYLKFMKERALVDAFGDNKSKFDEVWKEVTHWQNGIKPSDSWVMYAAKWEDGAWKVGLLEVKTTVKNQMREMALGFSTDVQSPDPFSDPDDGICVIINKKGEKEKTEYTASLESKKVDKFNTAYIPTPLTDSMLEEWSKLTPLRKLYNGSFKHSDLKLQVDGLKRFDEKFSKKHSINGAFAYDEFFDIIEQIHSSLPEESSNEKEEERKEEPKETKAASGKPKKQSQDEVEVIEQDDLDKTFSKEPGLVTAKSEPTDTKSRLEAIKAKMGRS